MMILRTVYLCKSSLHHFVAVYGGPQLKFHFSCIIFYSLYTFQAHIFFTKGFGVEEYWDIQADENFVVEKWFDTIIILCIWSIVFTIHYGFALVWFHVQKLWFHGFAQSLLEVFQWILLTRLWPQLPLLCQVTKVRHHLEVFLTCNTEWHTTQQPTSTHSRGSAENNGVVSCP